MRWFKRRIQYIPRNMHTVFALLCFVVVIHWLIFPYHSGLLHWHCGNLTIAPVPAKQPWWIWINTSCEFIMDDCITTTKQSTTKPCAYFLGYTVYASVTWIITGSGNSLASARRQGITWTNADFLSAGPLTAWERISVKLESRNKRKLILKVSSANRDNFYLKRIFKSTSLVPRSQSTHCIRSWYRKPYNFNVQITYCALPRHSVEQWSRPPVRAEGACVLVGTWRPYGQDQ